MPSRRTLAHTTTTSARERPFVTLLDQALPRYDVRERHSIRIHAPAARVYAVLRSCDLSGSRVVRALFALRELPATLGRRDRGCTDPPALSINSLLRNGFILLAERPGAELVLGSIGRFWTAAGAVVDTDVSGFHAFNQPGYARAAISFALSEQPEGWTRLATETRVECLDEASRRRFRPYWLLIRPFSGLIRRSMLRAVKRQAERPVENLSR